MTMKPSISAVFTASVLALATCSTVYVIREISEPDVSLWKYDAGMRRYLLNTSSRIVCTTPRPMRATPKSAANVATPRTTNSTMMMIGIQKMLSGSRLSNRLSSIGLMRNVNAAPQAASNTMPMKATIAIGQ